MATTSGVEWAWQRQSVWSQTADSLRVAPERTRLWSAILGVAGGALALAGSQLVDPYPAAGRTAAVLAAVAVAAAGLLIGRSSPEQVRRWTLARSVAEGIKSEVHLFLVGVGGYSGADRAQRLDAEVQRLERQGDDLRASALSFTPLDRPLPAIDSVESYVQRRVRESQLAEYYEPRAATMRRRLRLAKAIGVCLVLLAAALAALTSVSAEVGAWAAVATTAAGAMAAYAASGRYETLWIEYGRTAAELRRLVERRTGSDGGALHPAELVVACEGVIAAQNRVWLAKWHEDARPGITP